MHEWALAEAVVESVLEAVKKERFTSVKEVDISLGELQDIEIEIFEFALKNLMEKEDIFRHTKINLRVEKTLFRCRACGNEWSLKETKDIDKDVREAIHFLPELSHSFIRCSKCGSPDFEVVKGRGVSIDSIRGEIDGSEN